MFIWGGLIGGGSLLLVLANFKIRGPNWGGFVAYPFQLEGNLHQQTGKKGRSNSGCSQCFLAAICCVNLSATFSHSYITHMAWLAGLKTWKSNIRGMQMSTAECQLHGGDARAQIDSANWAVAAWLGFCQWKGGISRPPSLNASSKILKAVGSGLL